MNERYLLRVVWRFFPPQSWLLLTSVLPNSSPFVVFLSRLRSNLLLSLFAVVVEDVAVVVEDVAVVAEDVAVVSAGAVVGAAALGPRLLSANTRNPIGVASTSHKRLQDPIIIMRQEKSF